MVSFFGKNLGFSEKILNFSGTIFAYGQTGTGKTHTMSGGEGQKDGVTQNSFAHIFGHIAKCRQEKRWESLKNLN